MLGHDFKQDAGKLSSLACPIAAYGPAASSIWTAYADSYISGNGPTQCDDGRQRERTINCGRDGEATTYNDNELAGEHALAKGTPGFEPRTC